MLNPVQKAIVLLGVCVAGVLCVDKCSPDCTGKPVGSKVPDPKNCTQYYLCLNGEVPTDHPLWCDPGEIFDTTLNECQVGTSCTDQCPATVPNCHFAPSPSVTSTIMETSTAGCVDSPLCTVIGAVAKCNFCEKEFYYCDTVGQEAGVYSCTGDLLFNPDPAYPFCILPSNCPYHPPTFSSSPSIPSTLTPGPSTTPTLTPSPSVTSTTMETSTAGCVDSLLCTVIGAVAKCNICQQEFFYCDTVGQEAGVYSCTGDLLFNPDPAYPYCILPTNCPYHPPYEH